MGGVARGFLSVELIDKANKLSKREGQSKQEQGRGGADRTRAGGASHAPSRGCSVRQRE